MFCTQELPTNALNPPPPTPFCPSQQMGELSVRERANAEALAALRERLSRVFSLFAAGALDSDGLLGELDGMGVSVVRGGAGSVPELVMPNKCVAG